MHKPGGGLDDRSSNHPGARDWLEADLEETLEDAEAALRIAEAAPAAIVRKPFTDDQLRRALLKASGAD